MGCCLSLGLAAPPIRIETVENARSPNLLMGADGILFGSWRPRSSRSPGHHALSPCPCVGMARHRGLVWALHLLRKFCGQNVRGAASSVFFHRDCGAICSGASPAGSSGRTSLQCQLACEDSFRVARACAMHGLTCGSILRLCPATRRRISPRSASTPKSASAQPRPMGASRGPRLASKRVLNTESKLGSDLTTFVLVCVCVLIAMLVSTPSADALL